MVFTSRATINISTITLEWTTAPAYPGWWAQRVELPNQISPEVVEREGVRYHRYTIARHVLVPLRGGTLTLPAIGARIGIRARSVFAPLQVVEREASGIEMEIAGRPSGPEGFSGAVGDMDYTVRLEPAAVEFGESAVLVVDLKGTGNLPLVEAPAAWPACEGCDTYPPEEDSRVTVDAKGIHGTRSWRMTVVPRQWGELELEPVTLAVYDTRSGQYRQQALGPLKLSVAPPPATPTPVAAVVSVESHPADPDATNEPTRAAHGRNGVPVLWLAGALAAGVLGGGLGTWVVFRRRVAGLPPRRTGRSPAERARELQAVLESWWLGVRDRPRSEAARPAAEQLRQELEAVRFAPGRADHSETISDLEERVRKLLRGA